MGYILGVHFDQTETQVFMCPVWIKAPKVSGQYNEENLWK